MQEYETKILDLLKKQKSATPDHIKINLNIDEKQLFPIIESLSKKELIKVERAHQKLPKLTEEAIEYLKQFPEEKLIESLSNGSKAKLASQNDVGLIWAKKNGWILVSDQIKITEEGKKIAKSKTYEYRELLNKLNSSKSEELDKIIEHNKEQIEILKRRKLLEILDKSVIKRIEITEKGLSNTSESDGKIGALSREIITSGRWEKEKLKEYDINADYEEIYAARPHPVHEFVNDVRNSWFNMGFTEVSGPIIESAFWNFDVLFSPQDHPTREMQDTFFLSNPKKLSIEDISLMKKVKEMHVKNWKGAWQAEIAQQALLRTHTTAVSARYINKFSKEINPNYPIKIFSIGKVFRNESIDYKHLAELYQTDGIIIGNNLTFSNLIDILTQFYLQLGINNIKFKPAYFPFVEPGIEVYYYDEKKKDTIELGGGGIIRKEITKAMGTNKTVLAWGLGLERLMFNGLDINNLTELYKNDIGWLRKRKELKL